MPDPGQSGREPDRTRHEVAAAIRTGATTAFRADGKAGEPYLPIVLRRLRNLVLSTLVSLILAEAAARAVLSIPQVLRRVRGIDNSSRRLTFVERHARGREMTFKFDVYDSLRGWALAPNVRDLRVFSHKVLNSNSRGIRGTAEYSYDRVPGRRRILVLGDSFTFGEEVSDGETFASVLSTLLPNTEVINLGVHGYGHDQMLLYYTTEGVKYRPDLVVLGYVVFDQYRNLLAFTDFAKPRFRLTPDGLRLENVPVPTPETVLADEPYRSKLVDLMLMAGARVRAMLAPDRAETLTWAILDDLLKTVRSTAGTLVLVYLPARLEVTGLPDGPSDEEQALERYCGSRGVDCLFLRPRFREAVRHGAEFTTRRHWDAGWHTLAAREIHDFLVERHLAGSP
jgi:hypothetical protein